MLICYRKVIEQMDSQTTLLVMGDHGMTITGDHGGESDDETNALLFAYTKQNKFVSTDFGSDNKTLQQVNDKIRIFLKISYYIVLIMRILAPY